ncbi:MAG: hypothetical protein AAGD25_06465 [Cyanobacteria bacterium P01_F01_bin.150]
MTATDINNLLASIASEKMSVLKTIAQRFADKLGVSLYSFAAQYGDLRRRNTWEEVAVELLKRFRDTLLATEEIVAPVAHKAITIAAPYAEHAMYAAFDVFEWLQGWDWRAIAKRTALLYFQIVGFTLALLCYLGLHCYRAGYWLWQHREEIVAAARLAINVAWRTAEWAYDELEPQFQESDMAAYIREHSEPVVEAEVVLATHDDFVAEMDDYFEVDAQWVTLGQIRGFEYYRAMRSVA